MVITSKSNQLIKTISSLNEKKYRKKLGLYLVEGIKPVRECITAGSDVKQIICTEDNLTLFPDAQPVTDSVFKQISSEVNPQGVIAIVALPETGIKKAEKRCILLDNLQDPGNLGTIIRTANAAGIEDIYLINCVDPYSPKCVRASMSGIFFVNIYEGDRDKVLEALSSTPLICADMNGENIFSFTPPEKFCLCIGNEGGGISKEIKSLAKYCVSIPMRATCESLNAAVSAGIAMYQLTSACRK
jgi:TrmH family RNA methyltransferase